MKLRMFPGIIFGLLGLNVAIVITTVYCATGDPSFAVDPAYYQSSGASPTGNAPASAHDPAAVYAASAHQPAWEIGVTITDLAGMGTPDRFITLDLRDADGVTMHGVVISAQAFHNARAGRPIDVVFEPLGTGTGRYSARLEAPLPGKWTLRLAVSRGDERWAGTRPFTIINEDAQKLLGPPAGSEAAR